MLGVLVKVFSNDRLEVKLFFNYDYSYKKNRVVCKHILLFLLLDLRIFLLFLCKCKFASAHFLHFGALVGSFLHQYVALFVGASLY